MSWARGWVGGGGGQTRRGLARADRAEGKPGAKEARVWNCLFHTQRTQ